MKKKLLWILILIFLAGVIIGIINNNSKPLEKIGYALDTQIRIVVYDKGADKEIIEKAYNEILRLDKLLSNYNKDSETAMLNNEKSLEVSKELKDIIIKGIEVTNNTNGSYDLTIYPLTSIWDYKMKNVPEKNEIENAIKKIGIDNIYISGNVVTLKNDAKIDISSIAKGYIADYIIDFFIKNGIKNALVDAGGNIAVIGNPNKNRDGFLIGIKDPDIKGSEALGHLNLKNKSIVTSGIYERNFTHEGKIYHHIIDTKTGYPSESDVVSASIIANSSALADAYATAVVVMGSKEGLSLVESIDEIECIIVTKDNTILKSSGVKDFVISNNKYTFGG